MSWHVHDDRCREAGDSGAKEGFDWDTRGKISQTLVVGPLPVPTDRWLCAEQCGRIFSVLLGLQLHVRRYNVRSMAGRGGPGYVAVTMYTKAQAQQMLEAFNSRSSILHASTIPHMTTEQVACLIVRPMLTRKEIAEVEYLSESETEGTG